jgi:polysaccharide biosynthesis transport protein
MSVASQPPRFPSGGQPIDAGLDLPALGTALWRNKRKILLPTVVVGLFTLVAVQMITPRYLSETRVFIEGRDNVYLRPDVDKDISDRNDVDEQAVTSQAQIILSRDLAREVIDKLKLGERAEFDPTLGGISPVRAVLGTLGFIKNPMSMTPEERVLEAYYDRLTVSPVEKSRIITIDFVSEDPELAARVANTIADAYLERQREAKQDQAKMAAEYLAGEIETMRKKVADTDAKVEAFRAKSNLLIGTNNTTLSAQQLGDFNAQLAAARAQKSDAEAKAKLIREMLSSGKPIESSDILNSELVRRLSEQRVTLRAQLAEQSSSLLDGHPRIKELKAQIADLDRQIDEAAATLARSLENDAKLAGARVDSLTASLDQLKNQAASTNEQDVQLRALEMDAKSQRDLLESYLAKYREATARDTINSAPADARVISRATLSNIPAYPKKLPTVLIATLTTLVLAAGFVLTKELLAAPAGATPPSRTRRPAVPTEPSLSGSLMSRMAAVVGKARPAEAAPAAQAAQAALPISTVGDVAESVRSSGTAEGRIAVVAVANALEAGKTALKLARSLADEAHVVLVGLDPTDDAIQAASSDPSACGLSELAARAASFGDIITKDQQSGLHLISCGHAPADQRAILSAPGMGTSFDALARSYDHLVVDAGAIAEAALEHIAEIAPHAVLLVGTLGKSATASARERLLAAGFEDVTVLAGGLADHVPETAAAA